MLKKALDAYVSQINEIFMDNSASPELSYRYPFQKLLEFGLKNVSKVEVKVIHEGKTIKDTGKPDFFIKNAKLGHTISYIETKAINSNEIKEEHHQIGRYVSNLETVCTTDYCNFQLFKDGKLSKSFQLLKLKKNKFELVNSEISEFEDILRAISLDSLKQEITSETLAVLFS